MVLRAATSLLGALEGVGPKKSGFSGPTPSNAPRNDVARLKTIMYRIIKTTGTLIVIFCLESYSVMFWSWYYFWPWYSFCLCIPGFRAPHTVLPCISASHSVQQMPDGCYENPRNCYLSAVLSCFNFLIPVLWTDLFPLALSVILSSPVTCPPCVHPSSCPFLRPCARYFLRPCFCPYLHPCFCSCLLPCLLPCRVLVPFLVPSFPPPFSPYFSSFLMYLSPPLSLSLSLSFCPSLFPASLALSFIFHTRSSHRMVKSFFCFIFPVHFSFVVRVLEFTPIKSGFCPLFCSYHSSRYLVLLSCLFSCPCSCTILQTILITWLSPPSSFITFIEKS